MPDLSREPNDRGGLLVSLAVPETSVEHLIDRYDALLLDAYGVLIDAQGALPGAPALIDHLNSQKTPYFVVTNDASRLPSSAAQRYGELGLRIPEVQIITAGSLLTDHFETTGLRGARCAVVGPPDGEAYVAQAGGHVVAWSDPALSRVEALIIADEGDFDFLPRMNAALSLVFARLDAGQPLRLILPNPDLIYPAGPGRFGFTAGSMAMWIEAAIAQRYPDEPLVSFERLGKPYPAIFEAAVQRAATRNLVMIGDQLDTDIQGARAFGLDAVLATFGLTRDALSDLPPAVQPSFLLRSWAL